MNNKGNVMINLLLFLMGLGVLVVFIAPMNAFIGIAQGSNSLNCKGYIDSDATNAGNYSYNSSIATDSLSCLAIKLYLPYILLVFLVGGLLKVLYDKGSDVISGEQQY